MKLIPLSKRGKNKGKHFAQVDDEDYDYLMQWNWCIQKGIYTLYVSALINNKKTLMHRLLLGLTDPKILGDHRDHNGLNNQRNNLRRATHVENAQNMSIKKRKSKGVYFRRRKIYKRKDDGSSFVLKEGWIVKIMANKKNNFIGTFKTKKQAIKAYDEAAKIHFGEFAHLNCK